MPEQEQHPLSEQPIADSAPEAGQNATQPDQANSNGSDQAEARKQQIETRLTRLKHSAKVWARMIKLEHSLFALPYAWLGAFLAAGSLGAFWPPLWEFIWLTVAMVGVRSFAMTLNRLLDLPYDAINPRTCRRALVTGDISVRAARFFAFVSALVYFGAVALINTTVLALSPVPILAIILYSYAKRYTWLCHFLLGFCLAFAPVAGWLCVQPVLTLEASLFFLAVLFWSAGFDMIYSTQDMDFDIAANLHSAPVQFGIPFTLTLAAFCHVLFAIFLYLAFWSTGLGLIGAITWFIVAGLLVWEHRMVKPDNLEKVNTAFFTLNAVIAALVFAGTIVALWMNGI